MFTLSDRSWDEGWSRRNTTQYLPAWSCASTGMLIQFGVRVTLVMGTDPLPMTFPGSPLESDLISATTVVFGSVMLWSVLRNAPTVFTAIGLVTWNATAFQFCTDIWS